jgi:hypothetical protein
MIATVVDVRDSAPTSLTILHIHTESFPMLSNGNLSQYFPQGAPQFGLQGIFGPAGLYGGNPGFGPESYQQGFAQQIPFGNSVAGNSGNPGIGPQIIWALGQLAQQVATQGIVAQQLGAALSQLAQHVAMQLLHGGAANVSGGTFAGQPLGSPHLGNPAFNPLLQNFGAPVRHGQAGNFGGSAGNPAFMGAGAGAQGFGLQPGQNPLAGGMQGFGGFAPQNPGWGVNQPAMN